MFLSPSPRPSLSLWSLVFLFIWLLGCLADAKAESVAAIKLPIDHLSASIAAERIA